MFRDKICIDCSLRFHPLVKGFNLCPACGASEMQGQKFELLRGWGKKMITSLRKKRNREGKGKKGKKGKEKKEKGKEGKRKKRERKRERKRGKGRK